MQVKFRSKLLKICAREKSSGIVAIRQSKGSWELTVMVNLDTLTLKVGEDIFIPHQEMPGNQHKVEVHRSIVSVIFCHELQDPLHRKALQGAIC